MQEPLVVSVLRGDVVEARHRVHAVATQDGERVASAGDPELVTLLRSAAKPLQARALVRSRPDLPDDLVAVACASHGASPAQLDAVRRLLDAGGAGEEELECGPEPTRLEHTCSGKHAGFLAVCRAEGWEAPGYRLAGHPLQRRLRDDVAEAAEVAPSSVPVAIDGCGVATFGLSLARAAHAFARLPGLEGGDRVAAAMRACPDLLQGPLGLDAELSRDLPGWTAKGGIEGLLCACSPEGLGVALKVEDGSFRVMRAALAAFLRRLGLDAEAVEPGPRTNSLGEPVGRFAADGG